MTRTKSEPTEFVVAGRGQFPIDMLRYDGCHPAHGADSAVIERSFKHGSHLAEFVVTLVGPSEPTRDRWASFGWKVST